LKKKRGGQPTRRGDHLGVARGGGASIFPGKGLKSGTHRGGGKRVGWTAFGQKIGGRLDLTPRKYGKRGIRDESLERGNFEKKGCRHGW